MERLLDREAFDHAIHQKWAQRFGCTVADLKRPGTELMPDEQLAGTHALHIWQIEQRAFVRLDPAVVTTAEHAMHRLPHTSPLTADHLQATLAPTRVKRREDSLLWYLYPPELVPHPAPTSFTIRPLNVGDAEALDELKAACAPDEVEEGEVAVEDEIGFGCFAGPQLTALATGFRLTGFMDIGVLTHPNYRRQGLGKAVVSALSTWSIAHEFITQYRCRVTNIGSHGIARALHFHPYFEQQSLYLTS